jgi:hypothetical protein
LQPSEVIGEYLETSVLRRFPAGRAFATATVFPGIPMDMDSALFIDARERWRGTVWGRQMHTPAFQRAANVGWSGYMFGGVMDLGLKAGFRPRAALESLEPYDAAPRVIPMTLSDVWHFETMACPETDKLCLPLANPSYYEGAFDGEGTSVKGKSLAKESDSHELGFGLSGNFNVTWTYMRPPGEDRTGSCKYNCHHVDNPATINGAKTAWSSEDGFDASPAVGSVGQGGSWPGARYRHAAWATSSSQGHRLYVFGGIGGKYEVLQLSDLWQMSRESVRRDSDGFEVLDQAACGVSWLYLGGDHFGLQVPGAVSVCMPPPPPPPRAAAIAPLR